MIWNIVGNVVNNSTGQKLVVCKSVSGSKYLSTGNSTMTLYTEKLQRQHTPFELDKEFVKEVMDRQNAIKSNMILKCDCL